MPTQSLTDQLRLLEEELQHWKDCNHLFVSMNKHEDLLAVAKGLEAALARSQAARNSNADDRDAARNERDALRAEKEELAKLVKYDTEQLSAIREENERCRQALEWIKTLEVPSNEIFFKTLAMKMKADEALASLSK